MRKLLTTLLDAILPPKEDVRIAKTITESELSELLHPIVVVEAWILSLFPYTNARVRSLIRSVKFYGDTSALLPLGSVVGEYLLELIADKKLFSGWNVPLLIPIPSSGKRIKERGYNQVERIAKGLLPTLSESVTYSPEVLKREERESQVRIKRGERGKNILGAFYVPNPKLVAGKHIILLDDVVESGTTLKDARRALLAAGAADVVAIAIAH